jgi:lipopolysaccharide transport protein LptA
MIMKVLPLPAALLLLAFLLPVAAQTPMPLSEMDVQVAGAPPATGSTVITSDELHMDETTHVAIFTGNVLAVGTNFNMKCQEMTVNFDKAGKVDTIISKGAVEVIQPGRITHCGQAIYYHDQDMFDLTDQPVIVDNSKTIAAPEIIIFRTKQSLYTKGGKSTVVLPQGTTMNKPSATAPTTEQQ